MGDSRTSGSRILRMLTAGFVALVGWERNRPNRDPGAEETEDPPTIRDPGASLQLDRMFDPSIAKLHCYLGFAASLAESLWLSERTAIFFQREAMPH